MRYTPTGAQVPIGNGGCGPDHWWTQSLTEATLYVPLPPGVVARDLAVDVSSLSLRVACRAGDAGTAVLLEGRFPYPVKASEAVWCVDHDPATRGQRPLDPGAPEAAASSAGKILVDAPDGSAGATLVVTLEKVAPTWWRSGLAGAPEIDATLVDSTVPLGDYDDETQVRRRHPEAGRACRRMRAQQGCRWQPLSPLAAGCDPAHHVRPGAKVVGAPHERGGAGGTGARRREGPRSIRATDYGTCIDPSGCSASVLTAMSIFGPGALAAWPRQVALAT